MASFYSEDDKSDMESTIGGQNTRYVPNLASIPAGHAATQQQLQRSISLTTGPAKIDPKAKMPGDFRTLRSVVLVWNAEHTP